MSGCQLFTKHSHFSHSIIGQAGEGDLGGLLLRLLLHLPLPPSLHLPALGPCKADLVVLSKAFTFVPESLGLVRASQKILLKIKQENHFE